MARRLINAEITSRIVRSAAGIVSSPQPEVAPAEIGPLSGRLEGIEGYDLAAGLRNVGGQLPMSSRVPRQFVRTYMATTGDARALEYGARPLHEDLVVLARRLGDGLER